METASIKIQVKGGTHTFVKISGEGIALEIAEELVEISKNMNSETLLGIEVIKQLTN